MFQGCKALSLASLRPQSQVFSRCMSSISKTEVTTRRNELFDAEKKRQLATVGRIEKIEVKYLSPQAEATLVMNKNISTPYDCARHISQGVVSIGALAMVDGNPWDMSKPLINDCELKILSMMTPETLEVNNAFWRTCSLMLGYMITTAFKDNIDVQLHSFSYPNIKSGRFVYDAYIDLPNWKPTQAELMGLSAVFMKIARKELPCERLEVSHTIAMEIFKDNPFKSKQIPDISTKNNNVVCLYRIGDHIDISKGPMVGNTGIIGRCSVTAVHKLKYKEDGSLYRFQGIALPQGIMMNHFAYGILEERARKLQRTQILRNQSYFPKSVEENEPEPDQLAAQAT